MNYNKLLYGLIAVVAVIGIIGGIFGVKQSREMKQAQAAAEASATEESANKESSNKSDATEESSKEEATISVGTQISDADIAEMTRTELDPYSVISMEVSYSNVKICAGDKWEVAYLASEEKYEPEFSVSDNILKITQTVTATDLLKDKDAGCEMVVFIPEGETVSSANLDLKIGQLEFENVSMNNCIVDSGVGNVMVTNTNFTDSYLGLGTGNCVIDGSDSAKMVVSTSTGSVKALNVTDFENSSVELNSNKGKVTVAGKSKGNSFSQEGKNKKIFKASVNKGDVIID